MDIIPSDTLNPQKARILLMLALTKTSDPKETPPDLFRVLEEARRAR